MGGSHLEPLKKWPQPLRPPAFKWSAPCGQAMFAAQPGIVGQVHQTGTGGDGNDDGDDQDDAAKREKKKKFMDQGSLFLEVGGL